MQWVSDLRLQTKQIWTLMLLGFNEEQTLDLSVKKTEPFKWMTQPWFWKAANSRGGCSTQSSESAGTPRKWIQLVYITKLLMHRMMGALLSSCSGFKKNKTNKKRSSKLDPFFLWLVRSTWPCKAARLEQINMNGLILNHFIGLEHNWSVI